jgi:hypothetical protein
MITVGLINEVFFIAHFLKQKIGTSICPLGGYEPVHFTVSPEGELEVSYKEQTIWKENIHGPESMFGIESCDSIARILVCIDNGTDWSEHAWKENLDFPAKS